MDQFREIAADLPAPRDDEPTSLRTDIVDELTDHLHCALNRELHSPASGGRQATDSDPATAAHRRVLFRFGNPTAIARRLWYDAMKEKIMSQRISTGAAVVAAVACVGMFVFMWQSTAANRAMLQQSQQLNSQLLEQMQGLAASLAAAGKGGENRPAEWNQLQIRCVADSEDGPPLEGVEVQMESASENTVGIPPATMTTDREGLADFGLVLYGQYDIELKAPNGMRTRQQISVRPGHDELASVVCPTGDALAELKVEPRFEGDAAPPESLRDRIWYLVTLVRIDSSRLSLWRRPIGDPRSVGEIHCFCSPNGEMLAVSGLEPVTTAPEAPVGLFGPVTQAVWTLPEDAPVREILRIEPGQYSFGQGAVCIVDEGDPSGRTLNQILIPDLDLRRNTDGPPSMVPWGQTNTLTFPVSATTFAMLNRIIEAAPQMEVAMLKLHPQIGGFGSNRPFSRSPGDEFGFGSRIALSPTSFSRRPRSPGESPPAPVAPLLTGVEVIAFPDRSTLGGSQRFYGPSPGPPGPTSKLLVLLTPEEREFLDSLDRLYATPVSADTERTSLDPAVKAELEQQSESTPADSPPTDM